MASNAPPVPSAPWAKQPPAAKQAPPAPNVPVVPNAAPAANVPYPSPPPPAPPPMVPPAAGAVAVALNDLDQREQRFKADLERLRAYVNSNHPVISNAAKGLLVEAIGKIKAYGDGKGEKVASIGPFSKAVITEAYPVWENLRNRVPNLDVLVEFWVMNPSLQDSKTRWDDKKKIQVTDYNANFMVNVRYGAPGERKYETNVHVRWK